MALVDRGADAKYEQKSDVSGGTPEVDGATAEPRGENPGDGVGDELKTRVDQVELESTVGRDAGLCEKGLVMTGSYCLERTAVLLTLKEECGLVGDEVSSKILRCVHQAGDGCSSQIGALE